MSDCPNTRYCPRCDKNVGHILYCREGAVPLRKIEHCYTCGRGLIDHE